MTSIRIFTLSRSKIEKNITAKHRPVFIVTLDAGAGDLISGPVSQEIAPMVAQFHQSFTMAQKLKTRST